MPDNPPERVDPRAALDSIPRERLPAWIARAIDIISQNVDAFPPANGEPLEVMEYLYPH
jgi:hypothetical protein